MNKLQENFTKEKIMEAFWAAYQNAQKEPLTPQTALLLMCGLPHIGIAEEAAREIDSSAAEEAEIVSSEISKELGEIEDILKEWREYRSAQNKYLEAKQSGHSAASTHHATMLKELDDALSILKRTFISVISGATSPEERIKLMGFAKELANYHPN